MEESFGKGPLLRLSGRANLPLAQEIGEILGETVDGATIYDFADGETFVRIDRNARGRDVFIIQPTTRTGREHHGATAPDRSGEAGLGGTSPGGTETRPGAVAGMTPPTTVDEIVRQVRGSVTDKKLDQLDRIAKRMLDAQDEVRAFLRTIRRRRDMMFYVNTSSIEKRSLRLSVRIHGVECGEVRLSGSSARPFKPTNHEGPFAACWDGDGSEALPWADPAVRRYLEKAAVTAQDGALASRESAVQAALIRSMKENGEAWRNQALVKYPAGRGVGVPYQFPIPITAREGVASVGGSHSGHADLLTRKGRGRHTRLRVLEIKGPGAGDVAQSLVQAVAHAAALQLLLARGDWYPELLGFPNYIPSLEATAVVADSARARKQLEASLESLGRAASSFPKLRLSALFYTWEPSASGRVEIVHELK